MPSGYRIAIRDYGGETSVFSVTGADMSAATYNDVITDIDDLEQAVEGIILGTLGRGVIEAVVSPGSEAAPSDPWAQRENKWLVYYSDNVTGKSATREIPTANLALLSPGTEFLNIASGAGATFKTAFEAYVRSEAGNAVTVERVVYVARDL